ncbi:hypothetical protein BVX98_06310 [bacterium F11]|nr:hypothetical protein BVX98_06310 [bacterium F11]
METFFLAFIPIFVAIDPLGSMPFFVGLTEGFTKKEKRKLVFQAVTTALIFGLVFCFAGTLIFRLLGITPADFQIAGGLLLLIFSVQEVFGRSQNKPIGEPADAFIGIVPIGIPIIAGPAMVTTLLILTDQYPFLIILLALLTNLVITLAVYLSSDKILATFGEATSKVSAKVFGIFLAAIGIMMIRRGLETILLK